MKLIVGLGNPEKKYQNTRHNVGFMFLDMLREKFSNMGDIYSTEWKKEDMFESQISFLKKKDRVLAMLVKPLTYMNLSGSAVVKIVKKYGIKNVEEDLLLVHDDLDLPLGKFKIQLGKSPQGHNGVKSVEASLKSNSFRRIRIGIENRKESKIPGEDYVLMPFPEYEKEILLNCLGESIKSSLTEIFL